MISFLKNINLQSVNYLSVFIRLCMATFFGGIIGLEREKRNRPAGFRTHILVCIGATLAMMTNQYIFEFYGVGDPTRLGAQVISGIGFLGAGTIIVTRNMHVKGLTTAAGLWASACMGLAIGIGFYSGAALGAVFIFLVITIMQKFDLYHFEKLSYVTILLEVETIPAMKNIITFFEEGDIKIKNINTESNLDSDNSSLFVYITVLLPRKTSAEEFFVPLKLIKGIRYVQICD